MAAAAVPIMMGVTGGLNFGSQLYSAHKQGELYNNQLAEQRYEQREAYALQQQQLAEEKRRYDQQQAAAAPYNALKLGALAALAKSYGVDIDLSKVPGIGAAYGHPPSAQDYQGTPAQGLPPNGLRTPSGFAPAGAPSAAPMTLADLPATAATASAQGAPAAAPQIRQLSAPGMVQTLQTLADLQKLQAQTAPPTAAQALGIPAIPVASLPAPTFTSGYGR